MATGARTRPLKQSNPKPSAKGHSKEARTAAREDVPAERETNYPLKNLLLDRSNPRFGLQEKPSATQADLLDHIVDKFGIDDVLSSLAVNGYFEAEPMVCRVTKNADTATVVEGNRRLAACLILTGDPRAARQTKRAELYQRIWHEHGRKPIDPVPVILFQAGEQEQELLSYLGVRHIVSAQPWDSYAKAAWVARVIEDGRLSIPDVALMIGDQHRTIGRLLQGYYFIQQLIETGQFRPEDSVRRGRGSVTEYPFSWVYTILGYSTTRNFLGLSDQETAKKTPLKPRDLPKAGLVARAMFGDRSKGRNAAIEDSREIGELASALASPEKVALLEKGKTIEEITRITKPIEERLREGLTEVRVIQTELLSGLTEQIVSPSVAQPLVDVASRNRRTAAELERKLREAAAGDSENE
jgi:hypothetical protein